MQQIAMASLPQPSHYDLDFLQHWLERPGMGNLALIGADRNVWGTTEKPSDHASDLIVLKSRQSQDKFSEWVTNRIVWFHQCIGYRFKKSSDLESGVVSYKEDYFLRAASFICIVIASILPVISIVALSYVQGLGLRLGMITVFTLLFSFCLKAFTTARGVDCFVASST
jgi:hypothetical protein